MATDLGAANGMYVYAVVEKQGPADYGDIGIDGAPIVRVVHGDLAALASTTSHSRIRPERRHLAAHNAVLKRALEEPAVLPMAFGLIADSQTALMDLLATNRKVLREQLARVAGRVEMGLRVHYEVPNVFEYFVNTRPELREARDAIGDVRQARHADLLQLGQFFERTLNEERELRFEQVQQVLARHGIEIKRNAARSEREVLNLACLLPRPLQAQFEGIVGEAAAAFDNHFVFDINGPWAPHNFVELNLKL